MSSMRRPMAAYTASQNRPQLLRVGYFHGAPVYLELPLGVPSRFDTVLCTTQRGSRSKSSAFTERHIIPRYKLPVRR